MVRHLRRLARARYNLRSRAVQSPARMRAFVLHDLAAHIAETLRNPGRLRIRLAAAQHAPHPCAVRRLAEHRPLPPEAKNKKTYRGSIAGCLPRYESFLENEDM